MKTLHCARISAWTPWLMALALALFTSACDSEGESPDPGMSGDPCQETADCAGDLLCASGVCAEPVTDDTCERGDEGCACDNGVRCNLTDDGVQLACIGGLCAGAPCTAGEPGCPCDAGACAAGLECSTASGVERCEFSGCNVGDLACGCFPDRTCTAGSCVEGVCADLTCTPGADGCACSRGYTCASGLECEMDGENCPILDPEETPCTEGNQGCGCLTDGSCVTGLICTGSICQDPSCPIGTEGCACLSGACGETAAGELLTCTSGICQSPSCPAGTVGCACVDGETCDDATANCVDNICKATECIAGTEGCDCLAGSCNVGLQCQSGTVCVDSRGRIGGACYDDNTCDRNARCDDTIAPAVCAYCDLGTQACQCQDDDTCLPGLQCLDGHCVGDETVFNREPPANAICYTPCSDDLVTGMTVLECDADGLMEGCPDSQVCDAGECVLPGGERSICFEDSDCPSFQLCMQGYCYAECADDSECDADLVCASKVCRQICTLNADTCPTGTRCDSADGQSGYCTQVANGENGTQQLVDAALVLSATNFELTNVSTSADVQIINNGDQFLTVTLTKAEHSVLFRDGTNEVIREVDVPACTGAQCPLWFLEMGETGAISQATSFDVQVPPHCLDDDSCPTVTIRLAGGGVDSPRWRGAVRLTSPVAQARIDLSYVEQPDGRWSGRMVYFANFEDTGVDSTTSPARRGWLERNRDFVDGEPNNPNDLAVSNGLLLRWGAFRNGNLGGGWEEFLAVLTATESGQWSWPSVEQDCPVSNGACYLYTDGSVGDLPREYVTSLSANPIPTGVTTLPMAFNLYVPDAIDPTQLEGRVFSEQALHYAGNPKVTMRFEADPADVNSCDPDVPSNCVNFLRTAKTPMELDGLELDLSIGGRYEKPDGFVCAPGFVEQQEPWLVPGFLDNTSLVNGSYRKSWCVDYRLPDYSSPESAITDVVRVDNRSLARGNPVPDGQVLNRTVELLDGALIDQQQMVLFFRERFPSFLGGEDLVAYGYILLERVPTELDLADDDGDGTPDDYQGTVPPSALSDGAQLDPVVCSDELLDEVLGAGVSLSAGNAAAAITALIGGNGGTATALVPPTGNATGCTGAGEEIHYLCVDTGYFNGGANNTSCWNRGDNGPNTDSCGGQTLNNSCDDGGPGSDTANCGIGTDVTDCGYRYADARTPCPAESDVIYFSAAASLHDTIVNHQCQSFGTCTTTLNEWIASGSVVSQVEPQWACAAGLDSCDGNALDRRADKVFFAANDPNAHFTPLRATIEDAFRYKTRFVSRSGTNLGFTPTICEPFSDNTPYCYDPEAIEGLRGRVDCLLSIYETYYADPMAASNTELFDYLEENFALRSEPNPLGGLPFTYDGFEKLYSELLIMLGDDAYTAAFESRFDLAGINTAGFEGDVFEDDGIAISGIAGFEMYQLHQAVQYYTLALDRFYKMSDVISAALAAGSPATARNFLSSGTVTNYFDRLIRASTQRSRALAEIARRYQGFNRPDLARRVAIRAYTGTYLESVVLGNLILELYDLSGGSNKPQLLIELENAQRRYRMALLDLATVFQSITDDVNFFGYAPDYIPFPALGTAGANADITAFDQVLNLALSKVDVARSREQAALAQTREFDTNEASFQAELTRIGQTYEGQLAEICGVFTAPDGRVFPAIEEFAFYKDNLAQMGDPCGFVGNGQIYESFVQVDLARLEIARVMQQIENTREKIQLATDRTSSTCQQVVDIADFQYKSAGKTYNLQEDLILSEQILEYGVRAISTTAEIVSIAACTPDACPVAPAKVAATTAAAIYTTIAQLEQRKIAKNLREKRAKIERDTARWSTLQGCETARIELDHTTSLLALDLMELQLAMVTAQTRLSLELSQADKLRQQATRIQLEKDESFDLAINVEAAKNDPNVRIYRNDSVLNAEIAFEDAIREAYRLTLVYQYYTSTSYAALDQLFLTRMISAGDYNLENYVFELRNAFNAFEEEFGNPDTRVILVSLRDDVLKIPRLDDDGLALTIDERAALMRQAITDPQFLNSDGYITLPFATNLDHLSPLTRNHKVLYVEANIEGNDNGDFLGRLYLRQVGTSTIHTVEDDLDYYRFPDRTAVINPFFNATREFGQSPEIYRNYRLRDRPLVNNNYELIINQRDELVNLDIDLNALTDIKLYLFYTDFTVY